jgi:hypothetical protein
VSCPHKGGWKDFLKYIKNYGRKSFMSITRGQKTTKLTLGELEKTVQERNHTLLSVTSKPKKGEARELSHVPKQGRVFLRCNKCQHEWDTKVYVYLERRSFSLGCRKCFETNLKDPKIYPNNPTLKKETTQARPPRRAGKAILQAAFVNGPFGHINNINDLILYLKENPNIYNDKVLNHILRNESLKKQKGGLKEFFKNNVSRHHIIPFHALGSPESWNLLSVTTEEHHELHVLRYQVYKEKGDLTATHGTLSNVCKSQTGGFEKTKQPKPMNFGVHNLPEEVRLALKHGMVFTHTDHYCFEIKPNTLQTTKQIVQGLLDCLPDGHPDKERILKNPTSVNYIRNLVITTFPLPHCSPLKKSIKSAYGFTVKSLI